MVKETIINVFIGIWPMILIFCMVLVSLRLVYLIRNKQSFIFYKEFFSLFFLIYIMFLFHVVTFQDVSWSGSNFTLFKEILRYQIGSELFFKNVIGNMIMFMPYGFFVSCFFKLKKSSLIFFLALLISITIETTQMAIGRVFDVDDILLNVLGALLGYCCYLLFQKIIDKLPSFLKKRVIYNILTLGLIILVGLIFII